jgi:DNA-binding Xre family transcriptional regulator
MIFNTLKQRQKMSKPTKKTVKFTENFYDNLLSELNKQDKTVTWLAKEIGVSLPNLYRKIGSKKPVTTDHIERMANALNVDPLDLVK